MYHTTVPKHFANTFVDANEFLKGNQAPPYVCVAEFDLPKVIVYQDDLDIVVVQYYEDDAEIYGINLLESSQLGQFFSLFFDNIMSIYLDETLLHENLAFVAKVIKEINFIENQHLKDLMYKYAKEFYLNKSEEIESDMPVEVYDCIACAIKDWLDAPENLPDIETFNYHVKFWRKDYEQD